ncbi:recombination regulator RecX [Sansalvadorimonas sp. 2012CJ34-2]|uniref:Regulatory protein RecX n=1 Tax=Parendozoicomonas callyspongiae TaxID=2942213 RepID=A0ABT0PIA1_9GAMM|nr:regulatory protein RecX [Sansalvadorimonas sp. 2012CJ34-2]MCL6271060.1 recombination regulator RecX [Sansalvadorimonas sp. 2012CJ34-2]
MSEQETLLRRAAMDLLARREHSRRELFGKLRSRAESEDALETVLDRLEEDRLLSDERFVETFVRSRVNRGYGPVRIRQELQQKGIDSDNIQQGVDGLDADWYELACESRIRKFGSGKPVDNRDRNKQMRYLQYRGFDMDSIREVMTTTEGYES